MSGLKAALRAHLEAEPDGLRSARSDVLDDVVSLGMASRDWGHIVTAWPRVVVRPTSVADIAATIRFAAARGLPVAARGAGHSPFGQGQAGGGVLLDMTSLCTVHEIVDDQIVVDAGARWADVVAATIQHGLTPPVLPDSLELTVGGTLSVGGIGGASQHHGAQTDLGDSGLILLYPLRADRLRTPLLRVPAGELVWLFAMLRTGDGDPATTARMIQLNGALHRLVRSAGGTVYPVNALPMTSADWRAHFGPAWDSGERQEAV